MIDRRKFMGAAAAASSTLLFPQKLFSETIADNDFKILPKRIKKGDTIGLIAPGYAVKPEVLENVIKTLEKIGLKPYHTSRIVGNHGYFSNTDEERAKDLNEMFANDKIDAILCARGGYGCTRIMSKIDYNNIKNNPKVLIGFSDVTALLNGIYKETGLVTFHGPVGSTLDDSYSIEYLKNVVMKAKNKLLIENVDLDAKKKIDPEYERYTITSGTAHGKIVGGSLTLINALIGTPHELDFTNAIVCIEDVEEAPYRIDRMLTQLIEGKTFKNASGIAFGVCAGCNESTNPLSFSLKDVILDRIKPLGIPAVYGMSFGHVENNFTFPIGIKAQLNANQMTLQLLEKAVD
ncbi:MAG: LD-carboxypeptidase [Pseudozobellia sp.]|nr:LD-carboxypeptidase [Pseudozobellia sp.]MBG49848.1 LD-carboxypeptidase [Pseudozobellia sp.]|tara:strand:+ start:126991 stop:128037 length:1047 start_codon:yes stop_codon:yes gene_type:complete